MRRAVLIPLLVGALFVGACGSDDKGDSDVAADDTTTTVAASDTTATTEADDGGTTDTTAGGASSGDFAEICASEDAATPPTNGQSVDWAGARRALQTAIQKAPSDIKRDFELLGEPTLKYLEILERSNGDFAAAAQSPEFAAIGAQFSTAEFEAASKRIAAWYEANCN